MYLSIYLSMVELTLRNGHTSTTQTKFLRIGNARI